MARAATVGQDIPTRRVVITNEDDMPNDYSTTPGGTIFGTTPGGTKIVYERAFLINMRNSPLARTPPRNLPSIPGGLWTRGLSSGAQLTSDFSGVTSDLARKDGANNDDKKGEVNDTNKAEEADDQFSMDI